MPPSTLLYLNYVVLLGLFAITWVSVGYWVYADSSARGSSSPVLWGLSSVLFWPIGVYYLIRVRWSHERERPTTRTQRTAKMFAVSGIVATIVGTVATPPDPASQGTFAVVIFGAALLIVYYVEFRRQDRRALTGT